jgi:hypothetical protein
MDIKYGIIAVSRDNVMTESSSPVYHFVGFENQPQFTDYISLYNELKVDEELGLCDIMDDLILVPASEGVVNDHKDIFKSMKSLSDMYDGE